MRSLHLFNAVLGLLAVALGAGVVRTVFEGESSVVATPPGRTVNPAAASGTTTVSSIDAPAAALPEEPDVLLTRYPFGKPLPEAVKPPPPPRVMPPPEPLPTLIGTLSVGNQSRALLKDGSRTDLFAPGDAVAGGTLVEVHADRVVIKRGETLGEVSLKSSIIDRRGRQGTAEPQVTPVTPESPASGDPTESRASRRQRASRQRSPLAPQAPPADDR